MVPIMKEDRYSSQWTSELPSEITRKYSHSPSLIPGKQTSSWGIIGYASTILPSIGEPELLNLIGALRNAEATGKTRKRKRRNPLKKRWNLETGSSWFPYLRRNT